MKDFIEYIKENKDKDKDINIFDKLNEYDSLISIKEYLNESYELNDETVKQIDIAVEEFIKRYNDGIYQFNEDLTNEGLLGSVLGGLTGFALGKAAGQVIAKVLGIEKGLLFDMLTSRLVGAALGASLGKKL